MNITVVDIAKLVVFIYLYIAEVTYLKLIRLDLSENRIATLPVELRTMTSLVSLDLAHNPLVSPPASVSHLLNIRYY